MAKFNEYPAKATPEDADTLMLYDAATKSNKLSPFSGIWNWIVGKLTNAVISNLQTNNKTVLGAINELNSKWSKEYDWRSYDDIMTAINSEKEITLAQGTNIFFAFTRGGHPYMVITCVAQSKDAVGIYADYFNTAISIIRYKDGLFEKIS